MISNNPYKNDKGYFDPTAGRAVTGLAQEEKQLRNRADRFIGMVKLLAELSGFEITGRIFIRDIKTGKEFR